MGCYHTVKIMTNYKAKKIIHYMNGTTLKCTVASILWLNMVPKT